MKRLFKLTTVALGLVVLGSCSNEDLFNSSNGIAGENGKGTLAVNVETPSNEMGLATRALTDENMSATIFEKSDKIRVYDNELHRWDGYQFDGSKFSLFTEADLTAPEFAIYPFGKNETASDGSDIIGTNNIGGFQSGSWSKGGITTVVMNIPNHITYKEVAQTDGTTAYWCSLPMWGKVTSTEGKLETDLKYMTAILRVSLKNAKTNVSYLRISAFKDEARTKQINLSGDFKATLNTSDFTKTQLGETLGDGELFVNVRNIAGSDAYVFVPIVPCTNAIVVIEYFDNYMNPVAGKDGKTEKVLSQKNYVRGTLYKAKGAEFDVTTGSVEGINSALVAAKAQTEPVEITANVTTEATDEDNEIIIPAGMKADITLNLTGITNIGTQYLYINDENSENPYKGNITVNTATPTTTEIVTQLKGANVQFVGQFGDLNSYVKGLAIGKAETTSTATLAAIGETVENVVIAKDATVGDIEADEDSEIDVNVTVAGTAGNILVTGDVIVDGGVVGNIGSYTSATDNCLAKSVTVTGAGDGTANAVNIFTEGDVTITDATVGKIGSANVYANDVTVTAADGKAAKTGAVNAEGNITTEGTGTGTVNMGALTNKSESTDAVTLNFGNKTTLVAINLSTSKQAATINFTGNAKATGNINAPKATVNLKNSTATTFTGNITADYLLLTNKAKHTTGIITAGKLVIMKEAQVADATAKNNVLVKLDGEAEAITGTLAILAGNTEGMQISIQKGYVHTIDMSAATKDVKLKLGADLVAIASVTEGTGKLVPAAASVWNGKTIGSGFADYKKATTIYTATQLASMSGAAADITLANNIDLGTSQAWSMPALTQNFTGKNLGTTDAPKYPEIKGLYLKAESPKDGTVQNIGLFSTIASGKFVKNITINGVTSALTAKSGATAAPHNIGAVAGEAGAVTIENVEVKALNITSTAKSENIGGLIGKATGAATITKSKVTATDIQGQYNLGGLIGEAAGNASLTETKVAITKFTVIDHAAPGLGSSTNDKAGSVGMYFGKIAGNVNVDDKSDWGTSAIANKRADLGYHQKFEVSSNKVYFYYGGYDGVGQWADAGTQKLKDDKLSIAVTTVEAPAAKNDNVKSGEYNQYVLQSKWK